LYVEGLITFNRAGIQKDNFGWQWDIDKIQEMGITDNVVDLMTLKIKKLGNETQKILNLAACIGNIFGLKTLINVSEKTETQIMKELNDALSAGLIIPKSSLNKETVDEHSISNSKFKFSHDRIQQAAYSLIQELDRKKLHYKIGQLLLKKSDKLNLDEEIFDIVNQLNIGIDLIQSQSEKDVLVNLNLIAGQKAKSSTAYEPAFRYLNTGISLLNEQC